MTVRVPFGAVLAVGIASGLFAMPATAQIASEGGPIYIDSQRSESFQNERKVVLVGNVDIQQGTARLRADRVTMSFANRTGAGGAGVAGGFGQIETITAEGNVFYVTPELKAKGNLGVYKLATDTITMTGDVALMRDKDVAEGQTLKLEIKNRRSTLDGGSGRARMVIDPNQQSSGN